MEISKRHEQPALRALVGAIAACAAAACLGPHPAAAADVVPVAAFGRLPTLEDVAISPDGTKIAFVSTSGESRKLVVLPLSKPQPIGAFLIGDAKLRNVDWVDDDNIVATVSSTSPPPFGFIGPTREWFQLVNLDLTKLKTHALAFDMDHVETFNVINGSWTTRSVAGRPTLYTQGYCVREGTVPCLFSFAYPDRHVRLVDEAREPDTDWLVDESGNIAAQFTYHDDKKLWEIRTRKDRHWTLAASGIAPIDTPEMIGFNGDGSGIIVRFVVDGRPEWRPLNLSDNTWGPPIAHRASFSATIDLKANNPPN